jgi:hypothetical protein
MVNLQGGINVPSNIRKWHVAKALSSVRSLREILPDLTEEEVLHVLNLEKQTLMRKHVTDLLVNRAVKLYKEYLHGSRQICCSVERRKEGPRG